MRHDREDLDNHAGQDPGSGPENDAREAQQCQAEVAGPLSALPRYFTPTSNSWLNMLERFFRDLTEQRLRRGIFRDVEELIMAIGDYIDKHNDNPKPFVWTAKASDVLEKVKRARAVLDNR